MIANLITIAVPNCNVAIWQNLTHLFFFINEKKYCIQIFIREKEKSPAHPDELGQLFSKRIYFHVLYTHIPHRTLHI